MQRRSIEASLSQVLLSKITPRRIMSKLWVSFYMIAILIPMTSLLVLTIDASLS